MEIIKGRIYKHFKGDYYIVEDIALDSETLEEVVVYRQLYGEHKLFIRKKEMLDHGFDIAKINEIYENSCRGFIHPLRTRERWETIMAEFEFLGGGIFLFDGGYCVAYKNGDRLEMSELCPLSGGSPFRYDSVALGVGGNVPIGAARLISERAKEIFGKAYGRYMNLMHN